jgi:hypothetical protein
VVVVVYGDFALQSQLMKHFEDGECKDSFGLFRSCWKPAITKQLDTFSNDISSASGLATATEVEANSVNPH